MMCYYIIKFASPRGGCNAAKAVKYGQHIMGEADGFGRDENWKEGLGFEVSGNESFVLYNKAKENSKCER